MRTLEDHMSFYAAYHQDRRNKATHFLGVPMIIVALFIPLAWLKFSAGPFVITGALIFAAAILVYYVFLDPLLALGTTVFTVFFVLAAGWLARQGALVGWSAFGVLFVGGWSLQLLGHVFEKRKPALADNLFQIFIAPIFLCAELFFALGYKPKLHAAVQARALQMRSSTYNNLTPAS
jgi:uncharacterized membrane protein YGL010W